MSLRLTIERESGITYTDVTNNGVSVLQYQGRVPLETIIFELESRGYNDDVIEAMEVG